MTQEREREHYMAGLEMPAWIKNGFEHWRCDRLDTPKYKMNSALSSNSSLNYEYGTITSSSRTSKRTVHDVWARMHGMGLAFTGTGI